MKRVCSYGFGHALRKSGEAFMFFCLFFTASCENGNAFISDIYFTCTNANVFEQGGSDGKNRYVLNSNVQTVLALNVGIALSDSPFLPGNPGVYAIDYMFSRGGREERPIKEFTNSKGEAIAQTSGLSVTISLHLIDTLSDYQIAAYANGKRAVFSFCVDSNQSISRCVSLYYANNCEEALDNSNLISSRLKRETSLQVSSLYALKCEGGDRLGRLDFSLDDDENIKIAKKEINSDDDGSVLFLAVSGKPGAKATLTIRAGDKKEESFAITAEKASDRLTADPPPSLRLIPIKNGYRVLAETTETMIAKGFSVVIRLNGHEEEIRLENKLVENGKTVGYYYDIAQEGAWIVRSCYRKSNVVTESDAISFSIEKDRFLQDLSAQSIISATNASQRLESLDDNVLVKTVRITIPPLNEIMRTVPESSPLSKYSPYSNARFRIEIVRDNTSVILPDYDWQRSWSMEEKVFDGDEDDEMTIRISVCDVLGSAPSDERVFCVTTKRVECEGELEYEGSLYEGEAQKNLYSLNLIGNNDGGITLYYRYSEDNGKTFSGLRSKPVEMGTHKVILDKPDSKGFGGRNTIFKFKAIREGNRSRDLGLFNASGLKIADTATFDSSDSVQDSPNIRKVRIRRKPGTSYAVSYAISDTPLANADTLMFTKIADSGETIPVIKASGNNNGKEMSRYVWIKTENPSDPQGYPFIERHLVRLRQAPCAITESNKSAIWVNEGIFGRGICLFLSSPVDDCCLRVISYAENVNVDDIRHFDRAGDKGLFGSDWDMCMAGYRHNRFAISSFTRKKGYMDSPICEYCGGCRSGSLQHDSAVEGQKARLMKEWRLTYAM